MVDVLIEGLDGPRSIPLVDGASVVLADSVLTVGPWPSDTVVRHPDGRIIGKVAAGEVRRWLFDEAGEPVDVP